MRMKIDAQQQKKKTMFVFFYSCSCSCAVFYFMDVTYVQWLVSFWYNVCTMLYIMLMKCLCHTELIAVITVTFLYYLQVATAQSTINYYVVF